MSSSLVPLTHLLQFTGRSVENCVMAVWNSGGLEEDLVRHCSLRGFGQDHELALAKRYWDDLEVRMQGASLPVHDPKKPRKMDERSQHHHGVIGPGKLLREIIASECR